MRAFYGLNKIFQGASYPKIFGASLLASYISYQHKRKYEMAGEPEPKKVYTNDIPKLSTANIL